MDQQRLDTIYDLYMEEYNIQKQLDSSLGNPYSKGFIKPFIDNQGPSYPELKTNKQIALDLMEETKVSVRADKRYNRMITAPAALQQDFLKKIEDYFQEEVIFHTISNELNVSHSLVKEVYNDIQTLQDIRNKYINNSEYRKVFDELYYEGLGRDWIRFHNLVSPGNEYHEEKDELTGDIVIMNAKGKVIFNKKKK